MENIQKNIKLTTNVVVEVNQEQNVVINNRNVKIILVGEDVESFVKRLDINEIVVKEIKKHAIKTVKAVVKDENPEETYDFGNLPKPKPKRPSLQTFLKDWYPDVPETTYNSAYRAYKVGHPIIDKMQEKGQTFEIAQEIAQDLMYNTNNPPVWVKGLNEYLKKYHTLV